MTRPKVVVLGLMSTMPVAGVVWQTLHYLLGFDLLGFDTYYVESHARTPSMLMRRPEDDGGARAASFLAAVMHRFGFDRRWAFHALHDDGRCFGLSHGELLRLYGEAACIVNLHGGTAPLPEHAASGRLVYVETDPVQLQLELAEQRQETVDFLDAHAVHFTFAENWGLPGCRLPTTDRFAFRPTRQPVVIDLWDARTTPEASASFTTVANWDQRWRDLEYEGELYRWNKRHEFLKLLELPARAGQPLELCLSACDREDRALLEANGWRVREATPVSASIDEYRRYVRGSLGEFTVAKDQNVRLRSGWFSDRSATYLAAGRPVVTQDTGFGAALPTGTGLFAYSTLEEAADALTRVAARPAAEGRAAAEVARTCFAHEVVLPPLLSAVGLDAPWHRRRAGRATARDTTTAEACLTASLVLEPLSKHPLRLPEQSERHVLATAASPVAGVARDGADTAGPGAPPAATIVVVTHDSPVCTRLCLLSALENTEAPSFEVVVVDNASADDTAVWLEALAEADHRVRLVRLAENIGFPAAVNRGMAEGRGEVLVVLNSDTIVTPGWLTALCRHLADAEVGLVGPVTNEAAGISRIPTAYRTYGELVSFAASRPLGVPGTEAPMLTLFCAAMRRDVVERVGMLDEGYGPGLFEDDDFAMRLRRAGYRLVCAEDAFVHHFGRGSFGALVPSGELGQLFTRNRARFERTWGVTWQPPAGRDDTEYRALVDRVRAAVVAAVPAGEEVAVCSRGDDGLLALPDRPARHFPAAADGSWAGCYPADDGDAVDQVESLRRAGCRWVVFPAPAAWWLERYPGLHEHLRQTTRPVDVGRPDCHIFLLDEPQGAPS